MTTKTFIVDVETWAANRLYHRLKALKSTVSVTRGAEYVNEPYSSQILLETTLSEEELEQRLYEGNYDYVGVIEKTTPSNCSAAICRDTCMFKSRCDSLASSN